MASPLRLRSLVRETWHRRQRVRQILLESLEPRQLLASDLLACMQPAVIASLAASAEGEGQTTYTATSPRRPAWVRLSNWTSYWYLGGQRADRARLV